MQVSELKKKQEAQQQLLRQKQKSDEAAKRLQEDIHRIKSQKVFFPPIFSLNAMKISFPFKYITFRYKFSKKFLFLSTDVGSTSAKDEAGIRAI